jgi:hypothetical protein
MSMFLALTVIFGLLFWFRYRARAQMQETFRLALDKGQELSPEIIERLAGPVESKQKDLRYGVIWLAIAVGLVLCGFAIPDESGEALRGILAGAAFPFAIGVAYLLLHRFTDRGE